ncbi:ribonuclease HII [Lentibacillus populi]|uniref:Ribonuclease HII n=1 Tax=Lentibacillus populi TaxID=1827502 RepID=A0A9W5TUA0_9BACI|nr:MULTISPECIES: ribonuclease HII [Bacillaceae]MBT2216700.1 ribonuclease HII [Virgibacillus dakarensis]GGB30065.1 ribonuclease HII [Lentibacillus populi]
MNRKSIALLKQLFAANQINEELIAELRLDERKGVQQLVERYDRQKQKDQDLEKKFAEMCLYENRIYDNGCTYIAGMDEAGRGPLAGPVVAAAVILPRDFTLLGLNDSKQLNEATRNQFFDIIKKQAVSYGISVISNQKIDEINIFEATKLAMYEAVNQLDPIPDHILIDAVRLADLPCSSEAIVKGDQKSISIAAASILAKVTRDQIMKKIHTEFPYYDFASNMGYGTKHHLDMLLQYGISPYHRKSYAPVSNAAK